VKCIFLSHTYIHVHRPMIYIYINSYLIHVSHVIHVLLIVDTCITCIQRVRHVPYNVFVAVDFKKQMIQMSLPFQKKLVLVLLQIAKFGLRRIFREKLCPRIIVRVFSFTRHV